MKYFLCVFIWIFLSCNSGEIKRRTYYPNGRIEIETTIKNGQKNGIERLFYDNGLLKRECHFKNNVLNGESSSYDSAGVIQAKAFFLDGKAVGPINYYFNGNLVLYNERDLAGGIYYVMKFDSAGAKLLKEEGYCITKNWIEDFTVNDGRTYSLSFFYAEPPGYSNELKAYVQNKEIIVKKAMNHLAVIELENIPNSNHGITIISTLRDKFKVIQCIDTLIKTVNPQ